MKIRRLVSLTALCSCLLLVLTATILFIVPHGRVAYWADWKLWGLSKTQWSEIHITLGALFLCSMILHIYYNWTPMISYLKNQAKKLILFTPELTVALALTACCVIGTINMVPPFSTLINWSESFKVAGAKKYGEPPYGHAELSSLKSFCKKTGVNLENAMARLNEAGYEVTGPKQKLVDIANEHGVSPQQVYLALKPGAHEAGADNGPEPGRLPDNPPSGLGNKTIKELCETYSLNLEATILALKEMNFAATPDATMKSIARENGVSPHDVYEALVEVSGR